MTAPRRHQRPAQDSVLGAIGGTPSVFLDRLCAPTGARVLAKLEYMGPTGSHKDRVALALIEAAEARGAIEPGMTVVDYTGGSTGAALAVVCSVKGYRCHVVCSDAYSIEKLGSMRALGAEVEVVPSRDGMVDAQLIRQMMARAEDLGARPGCHYLDMHHSEDPLLAGTAIGRELLEQIPDGPDVFCSGFGTGALLMGGARTARRRRPHPDRRAGAHLVRRSVRWRGHEPPDRGPRIRIHARTDGQNPVERGGDGGRGAGPGHLPGTGDD